MKKINKLLVSLLCMTLMFGVTACDDDDYNTNQIGKGTSLSSFGPNPVARGGELRFVGSNLNNIKQVEIPGCSAITTIKVITSGSPSEIRVTVPKDGPEVGCVTLTANDGTKITTETELTYTEPIALDNFSPSSIFPGEVLTIEGDYLNLIREILFSTLEAEKYFSVADSFFISHDRYTITLEVPEEAVSGKIIISDADEDAPNWIYSEENLEVKTATAEKVESSTFKAGDQMTISGTRLDLVEYVRFYNADGEAVDVAEKSEEDDGFTYSDGVITLAQPAEAASGMIALVMRSEVEVVAMEGFVATMPSDAEVTSKLIKNGETIDIEGENLDLVTGVAFYTIDYDYTYGTFSVKDGVISVTIPTDAIDGDLILLVASGESYIISDVELAKPEISSFTTIRSVDPIKALSADGGVTAGDEVIIAGKNIDLIDQISVGGGTYTTVTYSDDGYTTTLAINSGSGEIKYILKNGQEYTDETESNVAEVNYCYIQPDNTPSTLFYGTMMNFVIGGANHLTEVKIKTSAGLEFTPTYTVDADTMLYVLVPTMDAMELAAVGTMTLISGDNGSVEYDVTFVGDLPEVTVLTGPYDMGSWSANYELMMTNMEDARIVEGATLRIYCTVYDGDDVYWQLKIYDGHWAGVTFAEIEGSDTFNPDNYEMEDGVIEITLTADFADALLTLTDWGYNFIMNGQDLIVDKVTIQ